jgi:hypothetical protein
MMQHGEQIVSTKVPDFRRVSVKVLTKSGTMFELGTNHVVTMINWVRTGYNWVQLGTIGNRHP